MAVKIKKANEAQFFFVCGNIKKGTFEVAEFSGRENISSPYEFEITLLSLKADVKADDMIGKPATFFIFRNGEYVPFSGIVREFKFLDKNVDFVLYKVVLVPKIWMLSLNNQTRIFQNLDVISIIKSILDESNITNYEVSVTKNYPVREYVVQYNESDLNFISRLMEDSGLWYFFKENTLIPEEVAPGATEEKLVITDNPSLFSDISGESSILFRSPSGLNERIDEEQKESVRVLQLEKRLIPGEVLLKNYNYRKPEVDLTGRSPIKNGVNGKVYLYGGSWKEPDEIQNAAKIVANRIQTSQTKIKGFSNCRGLKVGYRFSVVEHFRDEFNSTYVLLEVTHKGGHFAGGEDIITYENNFVAITSETAENFAPEKKTPVPKINGIITAMIEANGSEYAHLDEFGRYKVRLPFDLSEEKNNCKGSKYIRMSQPYAGSQYGMHFPNHEGSEMVLACIEGDPDKPLGLGTVPNANTISPVVDQNQFQNIIRTAGGNEILLDDEEGKQKVQITTNNKHTILMDDKEKAITISSTDKNTLLIDDKNSVVKMNSKAHSITMSYSDNDDCIVINTAKGHTIILDDKKEKITIQTAKGHMFDMDDSKNTIVVTDKSSKNKVTLDGNGGLILDSKGKIDIKATQDLTISAANIKINANAKVEAKAGMDMKLNGLNLELKGNMNVKAEAGMNMEVKGGVQTKISGTMLDASGSAMTKIQGGVVMIN